MKLSDAIREGARKRPQHFGHLFSDNYDKSCAIGAAVEAIAGSPVKAYSVLIDLVWPEIFTNEEIPCPLCKLKKNKLRTITHLNDDHGYSREAIADWLDTL